MGFESTANYINELVTTNPTASDPRAQGDDHLRLIKFTLRNTFAAFTGIPVTATEAQLNLLSGLTGRTLLSRSDTTLQLNAAFSPRTVVLTGNTPTFDTTAYNLFVWTLSPGGATKTLTFSNMFSNSNDVGRLIIGLVDARGATVAGSLNTSGPTVLNSAWTQNANGFVLSVFVGIESNMLAHVQLFAS